MSRLIVAGGLGFFGRAAMELLRERGLTPLAASRSRAADVQVDVEDMASLERVLKPGDVLFDTVGPFQDRSTTLVEVALQIGCDVIDISDSLSYAEKLYSLRDRVEASGTKMLSSCSSVSVVTAALAVAAIGSTQPVRITTYLAPSTKYSASQATSASLLRSVGEPIRIFTQGALEQKRGWLSTRQAELPPPIGNLQGHLFESADSFWLPKIWPGLHTVDFYVDTRVAALNAALSMAARWPAFRRLIASCERLGRIGAGLLGRRESCLVVEVETARGDISHAAVYAADRGYRLAVAAAVLAAEAILKGDFPASGLVLPNRQAELSSLQDYLRSLGMQLMTFHD